MWGLYVTYVGGTGRSDKRKNHVLESVFFSWFALVSLYVTYVGGKGGSNKRKNHVLESVVFSWFAHTGLYVTYWGAREEVTNKKPHFRMCGFFVVCPCGPLCHLCGGHGKK